jgi:hypothetical protein
MKTIACLLLPLASIAFLSGCGVMNATESVPAKMDTMNGEVKKTNSAVHKQTLAVALAEMMKEENTRTLNPFPIGMLPAGSIFATTATPREIIDLSYSFLKDIDASSPDENDKVNGEWTPETVKSVDHDKMAKLWAIMVIMGLAPQSTVQSIVNTEINGGGLREETAYKALMLRYAFTKDILLEQSLFATGLINPGKMNEAVKYAKNLSFISDLPYADKISIKTIGMLKDEDNVVFDLTMYDTNEVWTKIDDAFDNQLSERYKKPGNPKAGELSTLRSKVKAQMKRHKPKPLTGEGSVTQEG